MTNVMVNTGEIAIISFVLVKTCSLITSVVVRPDLGICSPEYIQIPPDLVTKIWSFWPYPFYRKWFAWPSNNYSTNWKIWAEKKSLTISSIQSLKIYSRVMLQALTFLFPSRSILPSPSLTSLNSSSSNIINGHHLPQHQLWGHFRC